MNEADMERLLRDYPQEFFEEPLVLVSQQERFASGRTDLIFKDEQECIILVELKHGELKRADIAQVHAQVMDYLPEVERRYETSAVLWVVANKISDHRRTMERFHPVEFIEIPEARFREVASKYNVTLSDDSQAESTVIVESGRVIELIEELKAYPDAQYVKTFGSELERELRNSDFTGLPNDTVNRLGRWCNPRADSSRNRFVSGIAREVSMLLFDRIVERDGNGALKTNLNADGHRYVANRSYDAEHPEANTARFSCPYGVKHLVVAGLVALCVNFIYTAVLWGELWDVARYICGLLYVIPLTLFVLGATKVREANNGLWRAVLLAPLVGLYGGGVYLLIALYGWLGGFLLIIVSIVAHRLLISLAGKFRAENFDIRDIL